MEQIITLRIVSDVDFSEPKNQEVIEWWILKGYASPNDKVTSDYVLEAEVINVEKRQ